MTGDVAGRPGRVAGSVATRAGLSSAPVDVEADRAVTALYSEHYRTLVGLAAFLVRDTATAEEVVQDSFVAMHCGWRRLRDSDKALPYLEDVVAGLREQGIRAEVDTGDERMQKKIRHAQQQKVPYMLLAGDDDVAAGAVSFRYRSGEQKNGVPVEQAVAEIVDAVARRIQV